MTRGTRRSDDGAAAVEFALLFPVFVMLCIGTITFGFAFASWISVTQAARESSRFGATYPTSVGMTTWLNDVGRAAAENAGIDLATDDPSEYYICVRFVNQIGPATTPATTRKTWGSFGTTASTCTGSTLPDNRVEVRIHRKAPVNWVFGSGSLAVTGKNTSRYEPKLAP